MSKFDEAAAKYQRRLNTHSKCEATCSDCRYSHCVDNDEDCDRCQNFDRIRRRCKCNDVEYGKPCGHYEGGK